MPRIANLFRTEPAPETCQQYYELFLSRLSMAGQNSRVIDVCRQIRRFAKTAQVTQPGLFTFMWETRAYEALGDFQGMWRALRSWDIAASGKKLDLGKHRWSSKDFTQLIFYYAPVLYLLKRHRLGCRLMETALHIASERKGWSFDMLWHVYKPIDRPATTHEVTLSHYYSSLSRSLDQWPLWNKFVDDLHPKLLRLTGISRNRLRTHPELLNTVFERVTQERRRRLFSGATDGLQDLTDLPAAVRKRQAKVKKKILKLEEGPRTQELQRNLAAIFPELADLPPRPSMRQLLEARARSKD